MKKTIILIALLGVFLTGCTAGLTGQKEIKIEDKGKNCGNIEQNMIAPLIKDFLKQNCAKICEEKSYNYTRWNCTDDKVICVCVEK